MITLVHTGLQVPTDSIRITRVDLVGMGYGVAFSALLCEGPETLAHLTNDGRGSMTAVRPASRDAEHRWEAFAAQCCDAAGGALAADRIAELLIDEYEYARDVAEAEAQGCYLARSFDDHGIILDIEPLTLAGARPPDYASALAAAARITFPPRTARGELWAGPERGWVEVFRAPGA